MPIEVRCAIDTITIEGIEAQVQAVISINESDFVNEEELICKYTKTISSK